MSYQELTDLLNTRFINADLKIEIVSTDQLDQATCDIAKLSITPNLDDKVLGRVHRFVRLQRKLGWTICELDRVITALQPKPAVLHLTDDLLKQLSHIRRLRANLKVPLVKMMSWWSPIDTTGYETDGKSLYEQLFQNKTVIKLNATEEPGPFALNDEGTDLKVIGQIGAHIPALLAALRIGAADLALLTDGNVAKKVLGLNSAEVTDDKLNLANLSHLYRITSFARALKFSIRDFLVIKALTELDPFVKDVISVTPIHTANTLQFVEKLRKLRASGFRTAELDYLLRHRFDDKAGIAPVEKDIAQILNDIRDGLQKIAADTAQTPDLTGDLTRKQLASLQWDNALIEEVIAKLNDAKVYEAKLDSLPAGTVLPNDTGTYEVTLNVLPAGFVFPDAVKNSVSYDPVTKKLRSSHALTSAEKILLLNASADQDYKNAVEVLFTIPDTLKGTVSYDVGAKALRFIGPMTKARRDSLLDVSLDPAYQAALQQLFDTPRVFISQKMKAFELPPFAVTPRFSADLNLLPAGIKFPTGLKDQISYDAASRRLHFVGLMTASEKTKLLALAPTDGPYQTAINNLYLDIEFPKELQSKIYYDAEAKELRFIGWMTKAEKNSLLKLSDNSVYQTAIDTLFDAPAGFIPQGRNVFLTSVDVTELFDAPKTAKQRFGHVLTKLQPYVRTALSEILVKQQLGDALKLEAKTMENLLTQWINAPGDPSQKSMAPFLAKAFAESNPSVKLTAAAFSDQFGTYTLLAKIALLIAKFKITPKQLAWLFDYGPGVGWPDLNKLPFVPIAGDPALFAGWERGADLFTLRDQLPLGEATLSEIFALARDAVSETALWDTLSERTGWPLNDIAVLAGSSGFSLTFPTSYRDEKILVRLRACFAALKRLGVLASQVLLDWVTPDVSPLAARSIKQAVKAKYEDDQWLSIAKSLKDVLREKQRSTLVSYLVSHSQLLFQQHFDSPNDLFAHLLIDVEMSPCMMTSRIKQAIGSVQLFIQRCLMNLEGDVITPKEAEELRAHWKWMKNYRVWEANRKVFLWPENWIEPELRDNKTPFFKDLENELLQNEVTLDTAETAFLHYLEKLDQVARLEIVGMYHQEAEDKYDKDILHVFGRTMGIPHIYYYRQGIRRGQDTIASGYWTADYWTPWEKVDLDIEGDHLIPVVWNRRPHMFWPIFAEKAHSPSEAEKKAGSDPRKYLEIKVAWSEYKNKKWSPKKLLSGNGGLMGTPDWIWFDEAERFTHRYRLTSPDGRDAALDKSVYAFKGMSLPVVNGNNMLVIRCIHQAERKDISEVVPDPFGISFSQAPVLSGLFIGDFQFSGCGGRVLIQPFRFVQSTLLAPDRSKVDYITFKENGTDGSLSLLERKDKYIDTLNKTPGAFEILYPHQDGQFLSQRPFFYQDNTRTFFVTPKVIGRPILSIPGAMFPAVINAVSEYYYPTMAVRVPIGPAMDLASVKSKVHRYSHLAEL